MNISELLEVVEFTAIRDVTMERRITLHNPYLPELRSKIVLSKKQLKRFEEKDSLTLVRNNLFVVAKSVVVPLGENGLPEVEQTAEGEPLLLWEFKQIEEIKPLTIFGYTKIYKKKQNILHLFPYKADRHSLKRIDPLFDLYFSTENPGTIEEIKNLTENTFFVVKRLH